MTRWRAILATLPLPMLALAASYGVYEYSRLFVPAWVALAQAAAFEMTYLGLSVVQVQSDQRHRARLISLGAVVVSVSYNTLAGLFHRESMLLEAAPLWANVVLSLLHGAPLAWLAFLVADLLLHRVPESVQRAAPDVAQLRQALNQAEMRVAQAEAQARDAMARLSAPDPDLLLEVAERRISIRRLAEMVEIPATTLRRRLAQIGEHE